MGTASPRKVLLLGDPVAHSLSPAMHNAAFRALGIDAVYETRRTSPAQLGAVVAELRGEPYLGANVTIPHKEAVLGLVDDRTALVERIGAANTLLRRGTRLAADNTDARGFGEALDERRVDVEDGRVLVLGAGGAARACVVELLRRRPGAIELASRSPARAERLGADVGEGVRAVPWPARLEGYALVVNATPLGMHGEDPLVDVPLEPPLAVFDLVPTATETPLLRRARAKGCETVDGLLMLLHQAAASFELWTGRRAPLEVMRAALPRSVRR